MNQPNTPDNTRRPMRPEELFDEALKLKERAEKAEAEVARLRELLNLALNEGRKVSWHNKTFNFIRDELARLATAPEEPCKHETRNLMLLGSHWHWCSRCGAAQRLVDGKPFGNWQVPEETQDGATMSEWYNGFSKIESTKGSPDKETPLGTTLRSEEYVLAGDKKLGEAMEAVKEPTPEWRELGEDEVIGADDEYNPASLGEWIKVPHGWIGEKCDITRIRTSRPLHVQEEKCPHHSIVPLEQGDMIVHQCTSCGKKLNKFPKPKGDVIEKSALEMLSHGNVFACLRYLRDEIQKLKQTNNL